MKVSLKRIVAILAMFGVLAVTGAFIYKKINRKPTDKEIAAWYKARDEKTEEQGKSERIYKLNPEAKLVLNNKNMRMMHIPISDKKPELLINVFYGKDVYFDAAGTGFKVKMTFWVDPVAGLLSLDRNENGIIDDFRELVGSLDELRAHDDNKDGWIDDKDKIYKKLMVWVDENTNGETDEGELLPLYAFVKQISLQDKGKYEYEYDIIRNTGERDIMTSNAYIFYPRKSVYIGKEIEVSDEIKEKIKVNVDGSGLLLGFYETAALDEKFKQMLIRLQQIPLTELHKEKTKKKIKELIYRWAEVDQLSGSDLDKKWRAVEKMNGWYIGRMKDKKRRKIRITQEFDGYVEEIRLRLMLENSTIKKNLGMEVSGPLMEAVYTMPEGKEITHTIQKMQTVLEKTLKEMPPVERAILLRPLLYAVTTQEELSMTIYSSVLFRLEIEDCKRAFQIKDFGVSEKSVKELCK